MRKYWKFILTGVLVFFAQAFLSNLVPHFPGAPNLIWIFTLVLAFDPEDRFGWIVSGIVLQFLWDSAFGFFTGAGAVPLAAAFGVFCLVTHFFNLEHAAVRIVFNGLLTIVYGIFVWLLGILAGSAYGFLTMLRFYSVQAAYCMAIGGILLLILTFRKNGSAGRKRNWYIS